MRHCIKLERKYLTSRLYNLIRNTGLPGLEFDDYVIFPGARKKKEINPFMFKFFLALVNFPILTFFQ